MFHNIQHACHSTHRQALPRAISSSFKANLIQGLASADVDFDTTWGILERAFQEIHTKNASALSFEELYRNAYKIVLKKRGDELYAKVANFEERWLGDNVRQKIVSLLTPGLISLDTTARTLESTAERRTSGETFLKALKDAWDDHQVCMGMLTDVLMYMVSTLFPCCARRCN
jgi:cullin 3